VLFPFALIAGIVAFTVAPAEPSGWATWMLLLGAMLGVRLSRRNFVATHVAVLAMASLAGFGLPQLHSTMYGTSMLKGTAYGSYEARVDGIHSDDGEDARVILSDLRPGADADSLTIRRARVLIPTAEKPAVGATISVRLRLYEVPGPITPYGYDSQFHSHFAGIGAFGSAIGPVTVVSPGARWLPSRLMSEVRQGVGSRIDAALEGVPDAIARALIIGDQGQITEQTRSVMANAGLAHVLAISGLHLTLVAGGVFTAMRYGLAASHAMSLRLDIKRLAAMGGILVALFYLSISGGSVSAVRATIMLVLVFGAVLFARRALTMRNVAIAAILVIVSDPVTVFRPSFQLSFAAVVALVGVYEWYRPNADRAGERERGAVAAILRFLGGLALTSVIAGLATGLFAAFHFQQMAPLGVVGNVLAMPILAFIVLPLAFVSVAVMPFGFEWPFLQVMGWGIEAITRIAETVSSMSGDWTSTAMLHPGVLVIGLVALAWLAFFESRVRFAGSVVAVPLIMVLGPVPLPDVMVADTTQSLAVGFGTTYELIDGRDGSFAVRAWEQATGREIIDADRDDACDAYACFVRPVTGYALSNVEAMPAFAEDCWLADLVVTRLPAPAYCKQRTQVIDAADFGAGGVHWAYWTGQGFRLQPAINDPGRVWRSGR